jgi:hypothetical protein
MLRSLELYCLALRNNDRSMDLRRKSSSKVHKRRLVYPAGLFCACWDKYGLVFKHAGRRLTVFARPVLSIRGRDCLFWRKRYKLGIHQAGLPVPLVVSEVDG